MRQSITCLVCFLAKRLHMCFIKIVCHPGRTCASLLHVVILKPLCRRLLVSFSSLLIVFMIANVGGYIISRFTHSTVQYKQDQVIQIKIKQKRPNNTKTDPSGTPELVSFHVLNDQLTLTGWVRLSIELWISLKAPLLKLHPSNFVIRRS